MQPRFLKWDANELWHILIPIQIVGLIFNIVLAVLLGMLAVKQGAGAGKGEVIETDQKAKEAEEALRRPKLLIFNLLLTIGLIAILSTGFIFQLRCVSSCTEYCTRNQLSESEASG